MSKSKTRRDRVRRMRRILNRSLEPLRGMRMRIHVTCHGDGLRGQCLAAYRETARAVALEQGAYNPCTP